MRPHDDMQKANEERFRQWMDNHLNSPDGGELQAGQSPAAPGANHHPELHALAFDNVLANLKNDPEATIILYEHELDRNRPMDIGPQPQDPEGEMRWRLLKDCTSQFHDHYGKHYEDAFKFRTQSRTRRMYEKLQQHDPLFVLTKDVMEHYIQGLPPTAQRALERLFVRCPHEALEFYVEIRKAARKAAHKTNTRRKKQ